MLANWGLAFLFLFTANKIRFCVHWEHVCLTTELHQRERVTDWYEALSQYLEEYAKRIKVFNFSGFAGFIGIGLTMSTRLILLAVKG